MEDAREVSSADGAPAGTPSGDRVFAAGGAVCAVKLPAFEGPLDLLLHLIRANEVDIEDIPIALISAQYLAYLELMRELDIDVAAEYLLMAATLAHIKSRELLPRSADEVDEDEGQDPRAELARRLAAFAAFKEAARALDRRPLLGRDVFTGVPDLSHLPVRAPVLHVEMDQLIAAVRRVLAALPAIAGAHQVVLDRFTVQQIMVEVMDQLSAAAERSLLFEDLLRRSTTRSRVIATFLALLELAKIQAVRLFQNSGERGEPHGPIRARLALSAADEGAAGEVAAGEPSGE